MKTNICKNCGKEFVLNKQQELNYTKYNKLIQYCSENCGKELIQKYLETTNLKRELIAIELGISVPTYESIANKYNLKRTKEQIAKLKIQNMQNTMQEKYGITNAMEKEEFRQTLSNTQNNKTKEEKQEVYNKIKQTKLEKYGDENYHNKEQAKQTMLNKYGVVSGYQTEKSIQNRIKSSSDKYGVDNPFKSSEVHKLARQKMLERYRVETGLESEKIRNKAQLTNLKLYGNINAFKNKDIQQKQFSTIKEKYGVNFACQLEQCANSTPKTHSKPNERYTKLLNPDKTEIALENYRYDMSKKNVLIEIDPTYTHNTYFNPFGTPKEINYHLDKTNTALKNGYQCIHIFDWDDFVKIKNMFLDKKTLYARNLQIKEVDLLETSEFLNNYHLQNNCRGQEIRLGLYKDNELIEIMTFGKPRYNKNYEWELLRLCTKPEYKVVGGTEKLFKHFIQLVNPESIISYCDNSKFSGEVYTRLGFIQKGKPSPSLHWSKGSEHITDNLLRQRGFDQLFNTNYGKGTSNEELMIEHGWLPIYDCGQMTFIWSK